MNKLLSCYQQHGLIVLESRVDKNKLIIEAMVKAKPGSKKVGIEIVEGELVIKTNGKAVEGEANKSIVLMLSDLFSVSKSSVAILKGDKSKSKRIQVSIVTSMSKSEQYYIDQFTLSLKNLA